MFKSTTLSPITAILTLGALLAGCTNPLSSGAGKAPGPDPREENAWFQAGRAQIASSARYIEKDRPAKNVILFVGDGMGIATVTAARILEGQSRGETGEENQLSFETLPHVAFSKTYNVDAQVSDSASTMTAMVSGVKTVTGVLGVDETVRRGDHSSVEGAHVLTILEEAEARGLATGVVSTATVTHATPAGCYSHVPFRFWEDDSRMSSAAREASFPDIARQLVEFKGPNGQSDGLEVALGGGRKHFTPRGEADPEEPNAVGRRVDGRDLTKEWLEAREGSAYVWNRSQLDQLDIAKTDHLLGLFEPGDMNWETDRAADEAGEPSLAEMTDVAIELLSKRDEGFFLMVEAGRIDHGHHAGNAQRALTDTIALSDAVRLALEKTDPTETLIVVTADHSHTLTISGYPKRGNPILGKVIGIDWFRGTGDVEGRDALKRPYTTLSYANGPGYTGGSDDQPPGSHTFPHSPCEQLGGDCSYEGVTDGRPDLSETDTTDPSYLQESTVPMGTETHAGEDVPIYAGGPRAALFHGTREQNYIYHAMVEAFGWTRAGQPVE